VQLVGRPSSSRPPRTVDVHQNVRCDFV
jgi:hypothetical protein